MCILVDETGDGSASMGQPPTEDGLCPTCGNGELETGYGFAFGGGPGTYTTCAGEDCQWVYKEFDREGM